MVDLYPPIEPHASGLLEVGDSQRLYWETSGDPAGRPAVLLHGGPGQGSAPGMRRGFDPARYRIVLFDQRGCGRSTPSAADPGTDMSVNTTQHLVADVEALREHLDVESWLVVGGSWGVTLALAYAQAHPERVSGLVLSAVTTSRRVETEWLYRGARRFFPAAWRDLVAGAQLQGAGADGGPGGEHAPRAAELAGAYARLTSSADPDVRSAAARAWARWEDAVLSLEPGTRASWVGLPDAALVAMVRITAEYAAHGAWLEEGVLLRGAGRLAGIPGVILHGALDLSCPSETAWELAQAWPASRLVLLADAGHRGTPSRRAALLEALDGFARS